MAQTRARALTSSELSATFDLMTPLSNLLQKCLDEDSEKAITQAAEAFAQQINQCREFANRLEPVHSSIDELHQELKDLQKTLAAKMKIAAKHNWIEKDIDTEMVDAKSL